MKKKNDTFGQLIVGIFMVGVLLLLGYFTIVISGVDLAFGRPRVAVKLVFNHVGGLKEHDNVMYRGTKVGSIDHVEVTSSNLVVTALIDKGVVLRSGYHATVCSLSMLGGNFLSLEEGRGELLDLATVTLYGEDPSDWMQDMAKIARNLNAITSDPAIKVAITNFAAFSARARVVSDKIETFVDKANRIADDVGAVAAKVNADKDQITEDIKAAVADVRSAAAELKPAVVAFRKSSENFDFGDTLAKANSLLTNLNEASIKLRNGEGTLGKLNNDPKLYDEINGLIRDVRQIIDNYRDTTPISTFSSLAVGAF